MTSAVIVPLDGGLGNQLFLLASAYALATKFKRRLNVYNPKDLSERFHYNNDYSIKLFSKYNITTDIPQGFRVYDKQLDSDLTNNTSDVVLSGYFQSHKFFHKYRDDILSNLCLSQSDIQLINLITGRIRTKYAGKRIIGLQVRRTDYIRLRLLLPLSYYTDAMAMFPGCVFVITTDDIEWCKNNLPSNCEYVIWYSEIYLPDYIQMYIMSKLDGMIMANSTFGWWAAYIGNLKLVVAPTPWDRNSPINTDIYMDHWFKLQLKHELT